MLLKFGGVRDDSRLLEMVEIIKSKAGDDGRFTNESMWRDWKGWDFEQKRDPSWWITLVAHLMKVSVLLKFGVHF